jgi:hypothetical protein
MYTCHQIFISLNKKQRFDINIVLSMNDAQKMYFYTWLFLKLSKYIFILFLKLGRSCELENALFYWPLCDFLPN